jgi:hypothetical protein
LEYEEHPDGVQSAEHEHAVRKESRDMRRLSELRDEVLPSLFAVALSPSLLLPVLYFHSYKLIQSHAKYTHGA